MATIEIQSNIENKVLSRREIRCKFVAGNGLLTRQSAMEAIATQMGVNKEKVRLISLTGVYGVRDAFASAYVYDDPTLMGGQLPKYLELRDLSKEERKKAREALKKKSTETKPAGAAAASTPAKF